MDQSNLTQPVPISLFKLFTKYSDRFLSRRTVLALDILLVWVTYLMAQFISANFQWQIVRWAHMPQRIGLITVAYTSGFFIHKSFMGVVRLSGSKDFQRLFLATVTAMVLLIPIAYAIPLYSFSRLVLVVHSMLFLIVAVGGRLSVRSLFLSLQLRKSIKGSGVLIVGAGSMGRAATGSMSPLRDRRATRFASGSSTRSATRTFCTVVSHWSVSFAASLAPPLSRSAASASRRSPSR